MSEQLNVLSWNVHYPRFARDSSYVINTVESLGTFDVICLQEYVQGADTKMHEWLVANDYEINYLPFAHNLEGMSQGVMTATRKAINAQVHPVVLRENGPRRFRPFPNIRGLMAANVQLGDHDLTILNFHATYPRPHVMDMRKSEFESLKAILDITENTLLCGDFNFMYVDARRRYLTQRYRSFTGGLLDKTWRHHSKYSPIRGNLDYFFWNPELLHVDAKLAPFEDSDHRPMTAVLSLPNNR